MRYIRLRQLLSEYVPVSKATIYLWIKQQRFPAPTKFGKTSAWALDAIIEWQKKQEAA